MTNQQPEATHDEVVEYRAAKAADDGERVGLDELVSELDSTNRRSDAARIASEIRAVLEDNDEPTAFRRFLQLADNLAAEHGASRVGRILRPHALPGCRVATTVAPAHGLKCDDLSHRSSTFKMKA